MDAFIEILHSLKPILGKGLSSPDYLKDMIGRLCTVSEEYWIDTKTSDDYQKSLKSTLQKYYSKGLSKKLAERIYHGLNKEQFISTLDIPEDYEVDDTETLKTSLAEFTQTLTNSPVTSANVGEILFNILSDALFQSVTSKSQYSTLEHQLRQISESEKKKYGIVLLNACHNICSCPNCSNPLITEVNHQAKYSYEVIRIHDNKQGYDNLLAVCNSCFEKLALKKSSKLKKELKKIKSHQIDGDLVAQILNPNQLQVGLKNVINKLKIISENHLAKLRYSAVSIDSKIPPDSFLFLNAAVKSNVVKYFSIVEALLADAVKNKQLNENILRMEIRLSYERLKSEGLNPEDIYEALIDKLVNQTKENRIYCEIVICYFIQSCEVFDDTSK